MEWIKRRVWQLGLAVLLALIGAWLMYTAGTDDVNTTLLWAGLILVFAALAVPLVARIFETMEEREGEHGET